MDAAFFRGKRAAGKCLANYLNCDVTKLLLTPGDPWPCVFTLTKHLAAVDYHGQKDTSQFVAFTLNRQATATHATIRTCSASCLCMIVMKRKYNWQLFTHITFYLHFTCIAIIIPTQKKDNLILKSIVT